MKAGHIVDLFGSVKRRAKQQALDTEEAALPVLSIYSGIVQQPGRETYLNLRPIEARIVLRGVLLKEPDELVERRARKKANRAARRARRGKWTSPITRKASGR